MFIVIVASVSDGVTVLSLLMTLNILFIVYLCVRRPHSSKIWFGFDLAIELILFAFEVFMMVYIKQGANKIDLMSIITHSLGFLMANASLVIAIMLNLIAYYKIVMCIWELVKHLKAKGDERDAKNIDQMLQEEKQLKEEKKGDELTEGEGNYGD